MTTKDVLIKLGVATNKAGVQGIKSIRSGLKDVMHFAKSAAVSIGLMAIPFSVVVNSAIGFDKAMAEVSTIVDTSKVNMSEFRKEVHDLSIELGKSPEELTKGLYQTISAGVNAADAINFLTISTKASIAGVAESKEAVDLFTTVLNSYGMSAKEVGRVSDVAFESVRLGKTTFSELAQSMGNVSSIASQASMSIEEMFGAVTTLTKAGIDTATATTYLKNTLVGIIKPSGEAEQAAKKYGVELNASALKSKGFIGVLQEIKNKTKGNVTAITELFPNIRGMSAVMALAGNSSKEFADILDALKNATGATDVAFEKMESSSAIKIETALNAIKVVAMDIGAEALPKIVDVINEIGGAQGIFDTFSNGWYSLKLVISDTASVMSGFINDVKTLNDYNPVKWLMENTPNGKEYMAGIEGYFKSLIPNSHEISTIEAGSRLNQKGAINMPGTNAWKKAQEILQKKMEDFLAASISNIDLKPIENIDTKNISDAVIDSQEKFRYSIMKGLISPMQNQSLANATIINSATVG